MPTPIGTIAQAMVANIQSIAATYTVASKVGQVVELTNTNEVLVNFNDGSRLRFARGKCLTRFDRVGAELQSPEDSHGALVFDCTSGTVWQNAHLVKTTTVDLIRDLTAALVSRDQNLHFAQQACDKWFKKYFTLANGIVCKLGLHPNTSQDEMVRWRKNMKRLSNAGRLSEYNARLLQQFYETPKVGCRWDGNVVCQPRQMQGLPNV